MNIYAWRMRIRFIFLMLSVCFLGLTAEAQTAGWLAVEKITPGTPISVKTRLRILCVFQEATADTLVCEAHRPALIRLGRSEYRFNRSAIREVRLEHSDESNTAVGAAVGGGTGAAIGALKESTTLTRAGGALFLGGMGAIVGGAFGRDFPILHGEVVYKR